MSTLSKRLVALAGVITLAGTLGACASEPAADSESANEGTST